MTFDSTSELPAKTKTLMFRHHWSDFLIIGLVSFSVNFIILAFIGTSWPEYLVDYRTNSSPDARHYVLLGENFWAKGVYSRQTVPPYAPDIVRTPVYPLISGGVAVGFESIWPLYLLQVICSTATAWLVYGMTKRILSRRVGLIAGLLCASDLMLAILNFQALSETFFTFLATISIYLWVRTVWSEGLLRRPLLDHGLIGLFLGLASLTRPTGLYLPIVLFVLEITLLVIRRQGLALLMRPIVLVTVASLVIAPWIVRNQIIFDLPRLTTADTINLIYFAGSGVYQVEFGIEREEAQERIASDYHLVPVVKTNNFWLADESVRSMDTEQREAAWDIFKKYPLSLLRSTLTGLAKASFSHNTADLAYASGREWNPPGLSRLLHGDVRGMVQELLLNHPFLIVVFLWQILLVSVCVFPGLIGLVGSLVEDSSRAVSVCLLALMGYYMVTIAVVGIDAYSRHRSMIIPLAAIFVALGINQTYDFLLIRFRRQQ